MPKKYLQLKLANLYTWQACLVSLLCQPAFCQPALSACLVSLPCQPALSACLVSLPCLCPLIHLLSGFFYILIFLEKSTSRRYLWVLPWQPWCDMTQNIIEQHILDTNAG
jgi:hypothetical protein